MNDKELRELGNEIDEISNRIFRYINQRRDKEIAIERAELSITVECMKLQKIAGKLGVFYIDND